MSFILHLRSTLTHLMASRLFEWNNNAQYLAEFEHHPLSQN